MLYIVIQNKIRLAQLCNLIPVTELIRIKGKENISEDLLKVIEQDSWIQSFSLWEDRYSILKKF